MKRSHLIVLLLVLALAAGIWYMRGGGGGGVYVRLITLYDTAEKRPPERVQELFKLVDVTIEGQTKPSIFQHPTSRMTFKQVSIPNDAWLRVSVALMPEAWEKTNDGVLFRFGVSDGRTYDELVKQHVNPRLNPSERRWIPLEVDLSQYAGSQVDLIFNTNASLPGQGEDAGNDWAVWGEPEIVVRR
jgi:hypothetical protein